MPQTIYGGQTGTETLRAGSVLTVTLVVGTGATVFRSIGGAAFTGEPALTATTTYGPYENDQTFKVCPFAGATVTMDVATSPGAQPNDAQAAALAALVSAAGISSVAAASVPVIASVGTSISFRNFDNINYAYPVTLNQGYLHHACAMSGQRMRQGASRGISGAVSSAVLSTALPVVLDRAANPRLDYVVVECGTNNFTTGNVKTLAQAVTQVAQVKADVVAMCAQIVAFGAKPIIGAILRREDSANVVVQSLFDFCAAEFNAWAQTYAVANGWRFWDGNKYWTSVAATGPALISGLTSDSCHPNIVGARALGRSLAEVICSLAPEADWITTPGFVASATDVTLPVGTGGSIGASSSGVTASPGASSVIPQGWTASDMNANNTAVGTWSRDGNGFLVLNIPLAAATSGSHQLACASVVPVVGQRYMAFAVLQVENGDRGLYSAYVRLIANGGNAAIDGLQNGVTNLFFAAGNQYMVLCTPEVTCTTTNGVAAQVLLRYTAPLSTGAIDVRVINAGLFRTA